MRIATYLGLVARRVWAKKGILLGSLLGATLVIALLVVVPLYEASVQAVDLKFSIDNALQEETDVSAFATFNAYDAGSAEFNRTVVDDAQQAWLQPWYPTVEERTQTREFAVIPSGPDAFVDFIALADAWRLQYCAVLASTTPTEVPSACDEFEDLENVDTGGVTDPEEFERPPYPTPPQEALQVRLFTSPDLPDLLEVVDGAFSDDGSVDPNAYEPIEIMIGLGVAELTGAGIGDAFFIKPFSGLPEVFEYVEVAAIVTPASRTAAVWGVDDPDRMIYWDDTVFNQWLASNPAAAEDPWLRTERGLPQTAATQRWRMPLDKPTVELQDVNDLQGRLVQFRAQLARDSGGSIPATTFITSLLTEFTTRSVIIGGPILAMLALVVGGAVYFLVYTSALTVEREGPEIALLKSRGASAWQTTGIHLGQSLVIAAIAALVAPFVARFLVGLTGRIPPLTTLTGGGALEVSQIRSIVPFMVAGGAITFVAMGVTILPYARRGVLALRSLAARPGTKSIWQKYNIDLFAIALSLVLLIQLRLRGFINQSGDEATLDPLAVIFPALLLFTGALILLRVFPYVLRLVGWLFTKPRNLSVALTGWHLGRNPVPYGRLALLVWVTTGLGAFALTYAATLEQSYADRAAFAAGADVRVVGQDAGYAIAPEGSLGTPVLRTDGAPRQSGRRAEALAVRPDEFARVVTWRSDYGAATPEEVFSLLRPDGPPDVGVEIPEDATTIEVEGVVFPPTLAEGTSGDRAAGTEHRLLVRVIDADTRVWTMAADADFVDTAWTNVTIDLATARNTTYFQPPRPPLSMTAMWVELSNATTGVVIDGDTLLLTDLTAVGPSGRVILDTTEMTAVNQLFVDREADASEAALARYEDLPEGTAPPTQTEIEADPLWRTGEVTRWSLPPLQTRSTTDIPQMWRIPADIKVLLDRDAAATAGLTPGSVSSYSIGTELITGEMVGLVEQVPTASDPRLEGVMVIDLDAYNAWANGAASWSLSGAISRVEGPEELWASTDDPDAVIRVVASQMTDEPEAIWTIGGAEAAFSSRPVQVGLVAILFVGAATGVVLALAGVTGYVLLAVSRRAKEMGVLRALGFERTSVGITFALEQLVVIGIGAVIGVLGGILLVVIMLPFFQLGETADEIVPSILLAVPRWQLAGYIAIVATLLIASVLWATRRVSVRRMSEVLREVDR
ncbi:MAG TPA: ABC transporter permease [Acidimicrobiia bacterium]|nr:ABC transporter permease [Acidimicrobiia bacterium]